MILHRKQTSQIEQTHQWKYAQTCIGVSEESIGGKTCKETIIWGSCGGRYRWLSKNCEKWRWMCGGRELISKDVALVLNVSMALH